MKKELMYECDICGKEFPQHKLHIIPKVIYLRRALRRKRFDYVPEEYRYETAYNYEQEVCPECFDKREKIIKGINKTFNL